MIYISYCVLKSTTFHIDHYTVHIPRGGKFTIHGVTTNRHKLISLESKQSNIYHSTVCITIISRFTNYWLLPCCVSYIIPYLLVCYLSDLKLRITRPTMCSQLFLLGCHSVLGVWKFGSMYPVRFEVFFFLGGGGYHPFVELYVSAVWYIAGACFMCVESCLDTDSFSLYQPFVEWYVSAVWYIAGARFVCVESCLEKKGYVTLQYIQDT
jgi:hypothetical protein